MTPIYQVVDDPEDNESPGFMVSTIAMSRAGKFFKCSTFLEITFNKRTEAEARSRFPANSSGIPKLMDRMRSAMGN